MADLQVPPAVGSSGQRLDTVIINALSTIYRQIVTVGDPASSGNMAAIGTDGSLRVVTASSGAVQVLTSGTLVVSGTVSVSPTVFSLSSGTVTLSSAPTVNISSGTVTLSSAPTVNISSGTVTLSSATSLSSGIVTLSSNPTVNVSSGVFTLSSAPTVNV